MGTVDYFKRMLKTEDEDVAALTPIDIVWIEQRVTATLAANGLASDIDRGFLTVTGASGPAIVDDPISLAPLGANLLRIDRSQWGNYVWEWCTNMILGVRPSIDIDAHTNSVQPAEPSASNQTAPDQTAPDQTAPDQTASETRAKTSSLSDVLKRIAPALVDIVVPPETAPAVASHEATNTSTDPATDRSDRTQTVTQPVPAATRKTRPSVANDALAHGITLTEAIPKFSLRMVSQKSIGAVPEEALIPTSIPGVQAALCLGTNEWVLQSDLAAWGITFEMATAMAESKARRSIHAEASIVFLDDTTPVFVLESETADVAAAMPYLDSYVPLRETDPAQVIVALANEHVMYVHLAGEDTNEAAMRTLIESAITEHAHRPGLVLPALYRWSHHGNIVELVGDLDTAAGRLEARLLTSVDALVG